MPLCDGGEGPRGEGGRSFTPQHGGAGVLLCERIQRGGEEGGVQICFGSRGGCAGEEGFEVRLLIL